MSTQSVACPQCGCQTLETNSYEVRCPSCAWSVEAPDPSYIAHAGAIGKVTGREPLFERIDALPGDFASTLTTTRDALPADHPANDESMYSYTAAEFRNRREEFGLTAEWLADQLGVTLKTVQRWENGHRRIPEGVVGDMQQLSEAMGEGMARPWAEHLLDTDDAVMMIPRTGTHLGLPASWYRALVESVRYLLADQYEAEGRELAARLRVVYFDDVEEQK